MRQGSNCGQGTRAGVRPSAAAEIAAIEQWFSQTNTRAMRSHRANATVMLTALSARCGSRIVVRGRTRMFKHEHPDRRGQIGILARLVDLRNQFRQRPALCSRYFFQASPKCIFETDAGFVSTNYNRTFYDCRFSHVIFSHFALPINARELLHLSSCSLFQQ